MCSIIYLDSAATTQIYPEVLMTMLPFLTEKYANPGSTYKLGREIRKSIQESRKSVATLLNCNPEQVIFTSGGSEANNLALIGVSNYLKKIGKTHILVSAVEHDSVLRAALNLSENGFEVEFIPVMSDGTVSVHVLEGLIRDDTGLISIMYVNNEIGSVNSVEEIGALCLKKHILFHTDCVQAAGVNEIDVENIGCDFASISAHKIHGTKGAGALFVRDKTILEPIIFGGYEQEFGYRGGTENVPGIIAFGKACEITCKKLREDTIKVSSLKQSFFTGLRASLKDRGIDSNIIHVNGCSVAATGKILNLRIDGVDAESLIFLLGTRDVYVSAGSACRSRESEPSPVLLAIGLSPDEARNSIRISFSAMNELEEIKAASDILAECIVTLHKAGGDKDD